MNYSIKIFKNFYLFVSILCFGILIQSCQPDDGTDSGDIRDEYVGTWSCHEESTVFGTLDYNVDITKGVQDDQINISKIYSIDKDSLVTLTVFDNNITVNVQTVDGNKFVSGSGTSNTDYTEFSLDYNVISGGDNDNVISTFTK